MELSEVLDVHTRWVIDTAPVIYYIEENPKYLHLVDQIFLRLNSVHAFSSILILTEVLPHPLRQNNEPLAQRYRDFF